MLLISFCQTVVVDIKDGVYNISYKDLYRLKPFQIVFNNVYGYINKN